MHTHLLFFYFFYFSIFYFSIIFYFFIFFGAGLGWTQPARSQNLKRDRVTGPNQWPGWMAGVRKPNELQFTCYSSKWIIIHCYCSSELKCKGEKEDLPVVCCSWRWRRSWGRSVLFLFSVPSLFFCFCPHRLFYFFFVFLCFLSSWDEGIKKMTMPVLSGGSSFSGHCSSSIFLWFLACSSIFSDLPLSLFSPFFSFSTLGLWFLFSPIPLVFSCPPIAFGFQQLLKWWRN